MALVIFCDTNVHSLTRRGCDKCAEKGKVMQGEGVREREEQRSRKSNKIDRMSPIRCILTNALFREDVGKCLEFGVCSGIL